MEVFATRYTIYHREMFFHSPVAFQFESLYPGRGSCSFSDKLRLVVFSRIRREIALYLTRYDDVSTVPPFGRDSCRRPCSSVTRSISFFSARYCETLPLHTQIASGTKSFFTRWPTLSNFAENFLVNLAVTRLPRFLILSFLHYTVLCKIG